MNLPPTPIDESSGEPVHLNDEPFIPSSGKTVLQPDDPVPLPHETVHQFLVINRSCYVCPVDPVLSPPPLLVACPANW